MKISGEWINAAATQQVFEVLEAAGHKALFVGGCVRNALLGGPVDDIDIATDARPEDVTRLTDQAGLKAVPTGMDHGTITVVSGGIPHEVTTFRKDVEGHGRHATIAYSRDIEDDARRRDFTINALYATRNGVLIDPLNGLADLEARIVRFIEDPSQRIREDYLRILRFFRFHAWYGNPKSGLDREGLAAAASLADGLDRLSRERIGTEMLKLLAAPDPAPSVAAMRQAGVLEHVFQGADDRFLAPLVHAEKSLDIRPDAVRRLACLGGTDAAARLRLSNKQAQKLNYLQRAIENQKSSAELAYRHGFDAGVDLILLQAAFAGQMPSKPKLDELERARGAVFPVKAADLMPDFSGPDLGLRLQELEQRWIDSGFRLTRQDLL